MFTIDSSVLLLLYYLKTQIRNTKNKFNPSCGDPLVKQNESQVVDCTQKFRYYLWDFL